MTPNLQVVRDFIEDQPTWPWVKRVGVTNCRKIAGSQTYSQHSWSNAMDIHFTDSVGTPATGAAKTAGTAMKNAILAEFGEHIYEMLWQVSGHYDHIHVSTWPKGHLTPPCAGGVQRIKYKDGTAVAAPFPLTIGDDDMSSAAQKTLVDLAFNLFPDEVTGDPQVWLDMPEDDPQWWQYFNPAVVRGAKALYKRSKDGLVLPVPTATGTTDATARSMAQRALDALVRGAAALKP